jgi:hypothetical protein
MSEAIETGLGDDIDHTRMSSGAEIRHELADEKIALFIPIAGTYVVLIESFSFCGSVLIYRSCYC